jgi:threonine aldolase
MTQNKINLASDNWSSVHPLVMNAIMEANQDHAPSYGSDSYTEEAQKLIQDALGAKCKVFMMPTGTGANIVALKLACHRHESVICTDIAHIQYQESGAAESIIGCKLLTVPHVEGKINAAAIIKKLSSERAFGKHSTSPRVLSIAQPTEVGTVYTLDELAVLSGLCKEENLLFHIDGSRLYNAAASLKVSLEAIIRASQLDILSLGGTKNGLMGAEALVIFNPTLYEGSDHLQKQTLQLLSKMRYLSAQYIPFFKDNLWLELAKNANQRAQEITTIIKEIPQFALSYSVESNQIFFTVPNAWISLIQEKIFCYPWDKEKNEVRFITSWNTSEQDVKVVRSVLIDISRNSI